MSADGAHQGLTAGEALGVILGGEDVPKASLSAEQQSEWLLSASPDPIGDEWEGDEGYTEYARRVARYCLLAMRADPTLARADRDDDLYQSVKASAPEGVWGGLSGFQWGWASNAARRCVEAPPAPNPAIFEVGGS